MCIISCCRYTLAYQSPATRLDSTVSTILLRIECRQPVSPTGLHYTTLHSPARPSWLYYTIVQNVHLPTYNPSSNPSPKFNPSLSPNCHQTKPIGPHRYYKSTTFYRPTFRFHFPAREHQATTSYPLHHYFNETKWRPSQATPNNQLLLPHLLLLLRRRMKICRRPPQ